MSSEEHAYNTYVGDDDLSVAEIAETVGKNKSSLPFATVERYIIKNYKTEDAECFRIKLGLSLEDIKRA